MPAPRRHRELLSGMLLAACVGCGPNVSLGTQEFAGLRGPADERAGEASKARLIVLADMGVEPDERQQMIHLLLYANEVDLEGLIAVTGTFLRSGTHPELFSELIDGYAQVVDNLRRHAGGWPDAAALNDRVRSGQSEYGVADVGDGKSSPGSDLVIQAVTKADPRPVNVVVNAGSNTLAQALFDYSRSHTAAELDAFVAKLRVYENGAQDDAGALITHLYPEIVWKRSNYQTYGWGGKEDGAADVGPYTWEPYPQSVNGDVGPGQRQWTHENIQTNHGALGALYPDRLGPNTGLEGGGTTPWIGLVNKGLYEPEQPSWGGWGGRFSRTRSLNYWSRHADIMSAELDDVPFSVFAEASDRWTDPETEQTYEDLAAPVYRFRRAMFNDLKGRMDWCVEPEHQANHNPLAVLNGDATDTIVELKAAAGEHLTLDASASTDPDGDGLDVRWYPYPEAGTYAGALTIARDTERVIAFEVPADAAAGSQIHLVLEVKDQSSIVSMYDYRRVVVTVDP